MRLFQQALFHAALGGFAAKQHLFHPVGLDRGRRDETKGAAARLELAWMKRAAISLPDPAGPVSMTRPLDLVTFSSCDFKRLEGRA